MKNIYFKGNKKNDNWFWILCRFSLHTSIPHTSMICLMLTCGLRLRWESGGALEIIRARFYRCCIILEGRVSLSRSNEQRKRRTSHFTRLHSRCKFTKSSRATGSTMHSSPSLLSDVENVRIRCRRWHTWNLQRCKASVGTFPTVER